MIRHRQDEPRAANYDQLLMAEEKAKAAKKGVYGKKNTSVLRRVNYSETPSKAQTNLHFLKEKKRYSVGAMACVYHRATSNACSLPRTTWWCCLARIVSSAWCCRA